jgi:succinate dehydrogenase/fumarate reductase flavoprotein subunit
MSLNELRRMEGREPMPTETITLNDAIHFDDTTDLVVVGMGAAGASAAIEGRAAGLDVVVLERASAGGGSSALCGGFIYLGGGTRVQKLNGFDDTVEDMFKYLMAMTPNADEEKIRLYCENSLEHFDWLERQGIVFNNGFYPDKHVEHSTEDGLAWTGNEKVWPFSEQAHAYPRGHKVTVEGGQQELGMGGRKMMGILIKRVEESGARIIVDANVKNLIVDGSGSVVGVRYKTFEGERNIRARRGVLISTGGFAMNKEMSERLMPILADERVNIVGSTYSDGSGIELGLSAGGVLQDVGYLLTAPFYPPAQLMKGLLVNKAGKRFVAEDSYHGRTSGAILLQPEQTAYLILDNAMFDRPLMGGQQLVDAWDNFADMERDLGMPASALQKTLADYNANAASHHEDPEFHKYHDWVQPLVEPPFAALDCSLGHAYFSGFSLGGLATNAKAQVLNAKGKVIAGLYAAGACATNIAKDGMGYSSGTCVGESTFFGRQAGINAARA